MNTNKFLFAAAIVAAATAIEPLAMAQTRSTSSSISRNTTTNSNTRRTPTTSHDSQKPTEQTQPSTPQKQHATQQHPHQQQVGNVRTSTSNSKRFSASRINPNNNYRNMPSRGYSVSRGHATRRAQIIHHKGGTYYFRDGIYYHNVNDRYIVSRAPIGIRVSLLPDYRFIWLNNICYYYYCGTFYRYLDNVNQYEVVIPPVGAIVESIPDGYEKLNIEGNTYYIVDGVQYRAVIYDGEIWYEVIKIL